MFRSKTPNVTVSIPVKALEAIFDECDRFPADETGGRIIGTYSKHRKEYQIDVLGVIGPGPNAQRSATSFFQDGEYQESVFRDVEREYPNIEHLGNWHSHHPNGLETLSSGDRATYQRVVNHDKHNTDFLYALLVVKKTPHQDRRYAVKHFIAFRNDDRVHELPESQVLVLDQSRVQCGSGKAVFDSRRSPVVATVVRNGNAERARDQEFFSEFFPSLKPVFSKGLGSIYWKGRIALVDGSNAEVLAIERPDQADEAYAITVKDHKAAASEVAERYKQRSFPSARQAVLHLERDMNHEIYRHKKG
jgi:proteasome lid subunit RPN8/RPN11